MNKTYFVLCYRQGRWACTPPKPFADEAEARRAYDCVELSRKIKMKALVVQNGTVKTVLDSQGWHTSAETVTAMNKKTMVAVPPKELNS